MTLKIFGIALFLLNIMALFAGIEYLKFVIRFHKETSE